MHNRKMVAAILRQVKRWQRYKMEIISVPLAWVGGGLRLERGTARHQAKHTNVYQVKQQ